MTTEGWSLSSPGAHLEFPDSPQNEAAAHLRPRVIEFRILLKLEGEAD